MSLTAVEKTEAIKDLLLTNLPALLATASLDDFDQYLNKSPAKSDDKEICVYIDSEVNDVNVSRFTVVIQAQIYGKDQVQEYHSVIMPFLEDNLTGDVVEMQQRQSIDADVWPIDMNSTAFAFYLVAFETDLDDCA